MRYLSSTKTGIWHFRYQLPSSHRYLFDNRREIKRSLKTTCPQQAQIEALEIELWIKKIIAAPTKLSQSNNRTHLVALSTPKKKSSLLSPYVALERFYEYKSDHVAKKTIDSLRSKCLVVLDIIDKEGLKQIRRKDAEQVKLALKHFPSNVKKHKAFDGIKGNQIIALNHELQLATINNESVKDYIQKCSSFFEWCVLNEYTDINPFRGIKFKKTTRDSDKKNAYSKADLNKIFKSEIFIQHKFKHPHYYWLPLLAKLTGARLNELCQLYVDDVYHIEGEWCLSINDRGKDQKLKNNQSRRTIPLHPKLIDLGFIKYVQSLTSLRVFPELKLSRDGYGSAPSKWFGRFKTQLGFEKGHDFHSFRHTVATELKNALVPHEIAASLLGHLLNNITYDRYGKEHSLSLLKEAIYSIPIDSLKKVKPFQSNLLQ
ncbi:tyrosine-type recombinase/integrase [Vibrio splendidus]|nr:site-specific integrase [Vibrio splendidus]MCC4882343.1 site-specific integrase [Vibrio splendidus]